MHVLVDVPMHTCMHVHKSWNVDRTQYTLHVSFSLLVPYTSKRASFTNKGNVRSSHALLSYICYPQRNSETEQHSQWVNWKDRNSWQNSEYSLLTGSCYMLTKQKIKYGEANKSKTNFWYFSFVFFLFFPNFLLTIHSWSFWCNHDAARWTFINDGKIVITLSENLCRRIILC